MIKLVNPLHTFVYKGVRINTYVASVGEGLPRHEHTYSHATFCCSGSLVIRKENIEKTLDKNSTPVDLSANEWHELEAAEDGTVFVNVFAESIA